MKANKRILTELKEINSYLIKEGTNEAVKTVLRNNRDSILKKLREGK